MSDAFRPPGWAAGPHAQTLMARVLRPEAGPDVERERLPTPDGDFVDIDWGPDPGPDAPVVLILHGLEGSSRRRYVRSVARALLARGVRPVALNFRGCSGEPNRGLRFYHSGETSDPGLVLDELRRRFPRRRIGAMGFSLGGNVLLKLMGEREDGGAGVVDAAAVMSVPYDLAAGCRLLERSLMGRVYAAYFLRSLRRKVALKRAGLGEAIDIRSAERVNTIWSFDDVVTAPLHGFRDAAEYYARSSSAAFLATIRVPTLLVHAMDDPFLPPDAIPIRVAKANPHLTLSLHDGGGHVGFVEGTPWSPSFWADEHVAAFLADKMRDSSFAGSDRGADSMRDIP